MERTITFRGLSVRGEKWHYGYFWMVNARPMIKEPEKFPDGTDVWVDKNTVGQFTGVRDAVGIEIYEGDINEYPNGRHEAVQYVHGAFIAGHPLHAVPPNELKVIGNIYENPELLKTN